jgi:hypothetical protein
VAPTNQVMLAHDEMSADLVFAAADGDATTITHAMNLNPSDGSVGQPEVSIIATAAGTALTLPVVAFLNKDAITIVKSIIAANTGVTWRVTIKRPHSMGR